MEKSATVSLKLDRETSDRLQRLASARSRFPDSLLSEALRQYLAREENPTRKNYPRRHPVGGIITPL